MEALRCFWELASSRRVEQTGVQDQARSLLRVERPWRPTLTG